MPVLSGRLAEIGKNLSSKYKIVSRYLQNRCNILIALNAAVDVLHQFSHYIFAFYLFTGINYTTAIACWYLEEPPYIAFLVGMIFILLVGVDRVISVLMPIM